jgi:hypothetical protein
MIILLYDDYQENLGSLLLLFDHHLSELLSHSMHYLHPLHHVQGLRHLQEKLANEIKTLDDTTQDSEAHRLYDKLYHHILALSVLISEFFLQNIQIS